MAEKDVNVITDEKIIKEINEIIDSKNPEEEIKNESVKEEIKTEAVPPVKQPEEEKTNKRFSLMSIFEFFRDLLFMIIGTVAAIFSKDTYRDYNASAKNKSKKSGKNAKENEGAENNAEPKVIIVEKEVPAEKESLQQNDIAEPEKTTIEMPVAEEPVKEDPITEKEPALSEEEIKELLSGNIGDRVLLAQKGYELEKLVEDPEWEVRFEVAGKGYGLNVLIHDPDESVRDKAEAYLKDNNFTLEQWETEHPEKVSSAQPRKDSIEDKVADAEEKLNNQVNKPKKSRNIDEHEIE